MIGAPLPPMGDTLRVCAASGCPHTVHPGGTRCSAHGGRHNPRRGGRRSLHVGGAPVALWRSWRAPNVSIPMPDLPAIDPRDAEICATYDATMATAPTPAHALFAQWFMVTRGFVSS